MIDIHKLPARVAAVLQHIADHPGLTAREISTVAGIPMHTVYKITKQLEGLGLISSPVPPPRGNEFRTPRPWHAMAGGDACEQQRRIVVDRARSYGGVFGILVAQLTVCAGRAAA